MMKRLCARANNAARVPCSRKQQGLTLIESLLVLGVAAVIAVFAFNAYKSAKSDAGVDGLGSGAATFANQIKRVNGAAGYASVSAASVKDLVPGAWKYDGTNIIDNLGNTVDVSGGPAGFAMVFNNLSPADCQKVVTQFEGVAYKLHIGAATAANGVVSAGEVYKAANGTLSSAAISAGCGATNAKIAMEVR